MIKFLIGGSPCTHWSIAKSKNRETTAEGMGWELFKNYLIAKERFAPDFFLYENNKSAAQAIKDQISRELGAPLQYINSALVSAQNRQRFYAHNFGFVPPPVDRGILLQDILECGQSWRDKAYALTAAAYGATPEDALVRRARNMAAEQLSLFEPIADRDNAECFRVSYDKAGRRNFEVNITSSKGYEGLPVRVGTLIDPDNAQLKDSRPYRVYSNEGKSIALLATNGGAGAQMGLYLCPADPGSLAIPEATQKGYAEITPGKCVDMKFMSSKTRRGRRMEEKSNCLTYESQFYQYIGTLNQSIYRVENGFINIKDKLYPIKLYDGLYLIRKLTVTEACRLQTMPDDYCRAVSATQAYRGLGNGWTAEVIIYLLSHALRGIPKDEEIVVLSMYDGIGTGRYCFDQLGYHNITYYAYEIDKYAMHIAGSNYKDIQQCGDAFGVREARWFLCEEERRA
jgi:DNA (cytosine-5)-methyltransferase 3A